MNAKKTLGYIEKNSAIYRLLLKAPFQTIRNLIRVKDGVLVSRGLLRNFCSSISNDAPSLGNRWRLVAATLVLATVSFGTLADGFAVGSEWTTPLGEKIQTLGEEPSELEPLPLNASYKNKTTELTISSDEADEPPILLVQNQEPANDPASSPVFPIPEPNAAGQTFSFGSETSSSPQPAPTPLTQPTLTSPQPEPLTPSPQPTQTPSLPSPNPASQDSVPPDSVVGPEDFLSNSELDENFEGNIELPDGRVVPLQTDTQNPLFDARPGSLFSSPNSKQSQSGSATTPNRTRTSNPNATTSRSRSSATTSPSQGYNAIGENIQGLRREDGSMVGNPYAIQGTEDYHPSQFWGRQRQIVVGRQTPPIEAFGQDINGNPVYDGCRSCLFQKLRWTLQNTTFDIGVLGFRNPLDLNNTGNFGADVAINWSTPQRYLLGLAVQGGGRVTQTALDGYSEVNGFDTEDARTQLFWTSGLFYRDPINAWQFGAVYDSLRDTYYRSYTLGQVRTEVSRRFNDSIDIGFRGAFRIHEELVNLWQLDDKTYIKDQAQVTSYYTGFVRKYFDAGGEGMLFGGVTEWNEGLVGGQIEVPLSDYATLKNSFTYVFAKNRELDGVDEQTWNLSAGIVIYLGGNSRESMRNPLRPMFDVADNGTFLQNFKR